MLIGIVTAGWRIEGVKKIIECVDNQTYKNWQHIVVNDNNPELRKWYDMEGYKHFENGKRHWVDMHIRTCLFGAIARNVGAMIMFSQISKRQRDDEWICFLDDDNLWYPEHLQTLVNGHIEKSEATLIGVDMEKRWNNRDSVAVIECGISPNKCDLGNFLYNKKLFEKYGYFNPRPERMQTFDYELIDKIARGERKEKIYLIHKPTFIFYSRK